MNKTSTLPLRSSEGTHPEHFTDGEQAQSNKSPTRRVWIVEVKFAEDRHWRPTVGIGLTREDGRWALACWRLKLPDDQVRLRPYEERTT